MTYGSTEEVIPLRWRAVRSSQRFFLPGNVMRYRIYALGMVVLFGCLSFFRYQHVSDPLSRSTFMSLQQQAFPGKADEITTLPGMPSTYRARLFSGYLTVSNGGQIFYFLAEAQRKEPAQSPLLVWLNGGPGMSSLGGCFSENGPLLVNDNGKTLHANQYAWNMEANLLCLESPVGVGFSFNASGVYQADDFSQANDLYDALQHLLVKFPWLQKNDVLLSGESYAGVYVPLFARAIVERNQALHESSSSVPIRLTKFVVGNGVNEFSKLSVVLYAYTHGLIGKEDYVKARNACPQLREYEMSGSLLDQDEDPSCSMVLLQAMASVLEAHINTYDVGGICASSPQEDIENFIHALLGQHHAFPHPLGSYLSLCLNTTDVETYFNLPQMRDLLHANPQLERWSPMTLTPATVQIIDMLTGGRLKDKVSTHNMLNYMSSLKSRVTPEWKFLLANGVEGVIYHGDADIVCDFIGGSWAVESLKLARRQSRQPWFVDGHDGLKQNAGFVDLYEGLTFVTVRGAGHLVPRWKPVQAKRMLDLFVLNLK